MALSTETEIQTKTALQTSTNALFVGISSILIGVLDILLVIYAVAIPSGQRYDMGEFLTNYYQKPFLMSVAWIILVLTSMLALGVVSKTEELLLSGKNDFVKFAMVIGIVGYAASSISFITLIAKVPTLAETYVASSEDARNAIIAVGLPQLDPFNVIVLGGPGIWLLITNIYGFITKKLNRIHTVIGILLGVFLWLAVLAAILHSELTDQIAAGAGAIFAPIWFIWTGISLVKAKPNLKI